MPDSRFAKFCKPLVPSLPLLPEHRPQSAPEPLIKAIQYRGGLTEAEIASPSPQVCREFLGSLFHADSWCPARQLSDSFLEPQDGFRRNPAPRLLAAREAESQELPVPRPSHRTLRLIHFEFELRGEEPGDAFHHSFSGALTADVDIAIVRISHVSMSTSL
jgi:hypothetical protein